MITKIFYLQVCLMAIAAIGTAQQKPFTIEGKIEGKTSGYIYLSYSGRQYDSSLIRDGKFSFKGDLSGTTDATLLMDRNAGFFDKYTQLYITPGNMKLSVMYNNFNDGTVLKGSPVQTEADELKKSKESIMKQLKPLSEAYNKINGVYIEAKKAKKDEATLESLKEDAAKAKDAMEPFYAQLKKKDVAFMDKYPASFVTASLLRYSVSRMPLEEGENRYNKLSDVIKNSEIGKTIKEELDELRGGSPGAKAFDFATKELRGAALNLSDYKGKYVLLDFWASWCVPCRKGNPHLLSLYSKYKDKNFEIIGISDDDGRPDAWKKAVEKDQIGVWKHVLRGFDMKKRLAGEKNETDINRHYGIHSLPTKILIDQSGVIIGRYGGGGEGDEDMDKKLAEIFK